MARIEAMKIMTHNIIASAKQVFPTRFGFIAEVELTDVDTGHVSERLMRLGAQGKLLEAESTLSAARDNLRNALNRQWHSYAQFDRKGCEDRLECAVQLVEAARSTRQTAKPAGSQSDAP